ncbi:hypothetical protein [Bradyrhizobium sp.]|jgi:hypothetical protein|uniref:hypothetical protein n=1 Tax=Bradyrhizobium sp. TaxID=376 RepID=UPI002DFDC879|nr:hypothetical protein [Bradyrhizobium sp.]
MTEQSKNTNEPQSAASDIPANIRRDSTPTLFADGLLGGSIESGVVRLELLARQFDAESRSLSSAIVGRLVMPAEKFATFVAALTEIVKKANAAKAP